MVGDPTSGDGHQPAGQGPRLGPVGLASPPGVDENGLGDVGGILGVSRRRASRWHAPIATIVDTPRPGSPDSRHGSHWRPARRSTRTAWVRSCQTPAPHAASAPRGCASEVPSRSQRYLLRCSRASCAVVVGLTRSFGPAGPSGCAGSDRSLGCLVTAGTLTLVAEVPERARVPSVRPPHGQRRRPDLGVNWSSASLPTARTGVGAVAHPLPRSPDSQARRNSRTAPRPAVQRGGLALEGVADRNGASFVHGPTAAYGDHATRSPGARGPEPTRRRTRRTGV